jgi:type II secretory pathway pseudopilin PulG
MGIIAVLTALALPILSHVRDSSRRTAELSDLRQLYLSCSAYAQNNDGTLPPGRVSYAPPNADDYTWVSYKNFWAPLLSLTPSLNSIDSCFSVRDMYPDTDDFGVPLGEYGTPDDTKLGWIYWGGRDDLYVNNALAYRSPRRLGPHLTPGSQTLWTCWCWDSDSTGVPSMCPHIGTNGAMYASGVALKPPPDGLSVGLDDGSASFVRWTDLITIPQANGMKLYYQP